LGGRRGKMDIELNAQVRNKGGKGIARSLRREGRVPAVLYGPKTPSQLLSLSAKSLEKLLSGMGEESRLLQLKIEDGSEVQNRQVLVREVQVHPVRRRFLHVDLYEVPLDQPIVVDVHVELVGESVGVRKGGTLNLIRRTLSVRCLPGEIPEKIELHIADLDLGGSIHVEDLIGRIPYELADDPSFAVVNIAAPEEAGKESGGGEGEEA